MPSETLTIRVDATAKKRLEALAKNTGRSRSFLAADAIAEYLDVNEWQVAGITSAIQSIEANGSAAHADVKSWVESWDSGAETARPKPER